MSDENLIKTMAAAIGQIADPVHDGGILDHFMQFTYIASDWEDLRYRAAEAALATYRNATADDGK